MKRLIIALMLLSANYLHAQSEDSAFLLRLEQHPEIASYTPLYDSAHKKVVAYFDPATQKWKILDADAFVRKTKNVIQSLLNETEELKAIHNALFEVYESSSCQPCTPIEQARKEKAIKTYLKLRKQFNDEE